jgi:hypothetical protein
VSDDNVVDHAEGIVAHLAREIEEWMPPICFLYTKAFGQDREMTRGLSWGSSSYFPAAVWEIAIIDRDGGEHEWQLPIDLAKVDFHPQYPRSDDLGAAILSRYSLEHLTPPWKCLNEIKQLTGGGFESPCYLAGVDISLHEERLRHLIIRSSGRNMPSWEGADLHDSPQAAGGRL